VLWVALAALIALFATGCGTSVLTQPVTQKGDAWTVTIKRLTDGPDSLATGGFPSYSWTPGNGRKFLHAWVDVRNDSKEKRTFSFNRCDMDDPQGVVVPSVIVSTSVVMVQADRSETVDPGDSVSRLLVFSVPKYYSPKRLSCAPMVFPLPALKER
jgi:hypothetical protein